MKAPVAMGFLSALLALMPAALAGPSACGKDLQYMVGVRCGEDGPLQLVCGPPVKKKQLCEKPDPRRFKKLCRKTGKPVIDMSLTGCFSVTGEPWDTLGVPLTNKGFCRNFPAEIAEDKLAALDTFDSFEGPDPLANWDAELTDQDAEDLAENPENGSNIRVVCEDDPAPPPVPFPGSADSGFADLPGASDGVCAAKVKAGCDDYEFLEGPDPGTNRLSRTFFALNTGCGTGQYQLTFDYAWDNQDVVGTLAYDDEGTVTVTVHMMDEETVANFFAYRDYSSEEWETATIDLGEVPVGSLVTAAIDIMVENSSACFADCAVLIDNIRIAPKP